MESCVQDVVYRISLFSYILLLMSIRFLFWQRDTQNNKKGRPAIYDQIFRTGFLFFLFVCVSSPDSRLTAPQQVVAAIQPLFLASTIWRSLNNRRRRSSNQQIINLFSGSGGGGGQFARSIVIQMISHRYFVIRKKRISKQVRNEIRSDRL